jgi:iron(III) transport system ATP-binding protein
LKSVSLSRVSRRFGSVAAVREVSLDVPQGSFVTFLGPSGCGKTTTLRMIAGLELNDGGRIAIDDVLVSDADRGFFVPPERREAGMVFQSYAIWPHMTVFDNVAYPLQVRRVRGAQLREKTLAALRLVEMEAYAERPATALSGGQQQRVAIARAIVFEPRVLLLDEPLSNLDARLREQMRYELRGLQKRLGITTVYVTHDQEEAMALSDRIVVMQSGSILQDADPESIYFRPAKLAVAAFCGSPNLVAARAQRSVTAEDGTLRVELCGDGWQGWAQCAAPLAAGMSATVIVRPENVAIERANGTHEARDGAPGLEWTGTIEEVMFRGFRRTLSVRCAGMLLNVDAAGDTRLSVGERVRLRVEAARTWTLPEALEGSRPEVLQ